MFFGDEAASLFVLCDVLVRDPITPSPLTAHVCAGHLNISSLHTELMVVCLNVLFAPLKVCLALFFLTMVTSSIIPYIKLYQIL